MGDGSRSVAGTDCDGCAVWGGVMEAVCGDSGIVLAGP